MRSVKRALALLAVLVALPLAGCGFTPLYAAPGVAPRMAAVDVVAPQGRLGQLLREQLDDELGRDLSVKPQQRLDIYYGSTRVGRGLRIDNVVSRYEMSLEVQHRLVDIASGAQLHAGRTVAEVTYDTVDQPYAGIAAQQDAEARIAAEAARRIRLDLAAWLARQGG